MSTTTEEIVLTSTSTRSTLTAFDISESVHDHVIPDSATEVIPDGGYGWIVVFACSTINFLFVGWMTCWGIIQTALLQTHLNHASTSTLSFVGSMGLAVSVGLGLVSVRLSQIIGARYCVLLGVFLFSFGIILSSFTIDNIGGLFMTGGVSFGMGCSLCYTMSNTLPVQWFSSKLGTANGVIKLGGGIGGTVLAIAIQALLNRVGIAWTIRAFGLFTLAAGLPAALLIKERSPSSRRSFVDFSLFKSLPFCCLFLAGAIGTFALYVPPFFLPLFAHSIGLSASSGAGIVAGFNACAAIGRLGAGFACDKLGATNMLLLTMFLNAVSMLVVWPLSNTIAPLVIFAAVNGVTNGAFFVAMPTAVATMVGPGQSSVGMGMATTGWTGGYLMGSPIAGMLIAATGAETAQSAAPYRAAIFYAGGVTLASAAFVLVARLRMDVKWIKKL